MSDSVHGHDVMALMVAQENPLLKPEFIALMAKPLATMRVITLAAPIIYRRKS
ncbi:hypothetical protein Shewana3_2592 [Shewanella sp. ANA-3]|nr:hypothetical protein Shewana3_2592 [Shewanella sp. ANA-3]